MGGDGNEEAGHPAFSAKVTCPSNIDQIMKVVAFTSSTS
jgi:hypothetical protein